MDWQLVARYFTILQWKGNNLAPFSRKGSFYDLLSNYLDDETPKKRF